MEKQNISIMADSQSLQHAASKDKCRPNLNGVYFDCNHVVATDGHILAIKIKDPELDTPGNCILKFDSPKQKGFKNRPLEDYEPTSSGYVGIFGKQSVEVIDSEFPDYKVVFPEGISEETHQIVGINAELLMKLAMALDADKKILTHAIPKEDKKPILAMSGNETKLGAIMPCKCPDSAIQDFQRNLISTLDK